MSDRDIFEHVRIAPHNWEDSESHVRLTADFTAPAPKRSKYQARRDADLEEIEEALRMARDLIDDALEGFGMYADVQHRNLSILVGQQIEQVIEFRRIKQ